MFKEPDFLNTLLKETDGFSKYVKFSINYRGRKLSHALLLFHRSLIIKTRKVFVILHSAMCYTLTRAFQWKKTITEEKIYESRISQMSMACLYLLVSVTAVLEGSFSNFSLICKENCVPVEMQAKR